MTEARVSCHLPAGAEPLEGLAALSVAVRPGNAALVTDAHHAAPVSGG